mgnify:CR=1 FL=1
MRQHKTPKKRSNLKKAAKKGKPRRISDRYQGLNPLSMAVGLILQDNLPKSAQLLGQILGQWRMIMDGLSAVNATPTAIRFQRGKDKAVLTIACPPSLSFKIEHKEKAQIIARINRFIGRPLISRLKLDQQNIASPTPNKSGSTLHRRKQKTTQTVNIKLPDTLSDMPQGTRRETLTELYDLLRNQN